jgi:pimeloyl-ACP methyl ester carboxylesterase
MGVRGGASDVALIAPPPLLAMEERCVSWTLAGFDEAINSPRCNQTLHLSGGRSIGFAEYGDPNGFPLLCCHGYPASRYEPAQLAESTFRLIAPDRPGYGLSTAFAHQNIAAWASDARALLDHLSIDQTAVWGHSGGAPYACAVAAAFPARATGLLLTSAMAPAVPGSRAGWRLGLLSMLGRNALARAALLAPAQFLWRRRSLGGAMVLLRPLWAPTIKSKAELAALDDDRLRMHMKIIREAVLRTGAGVEYDARLYAKPSGVRLGDISAPTLMWHGEEDEIVPFRSTGVYRAEITRLSIHIVPRQGHYSLVPECWSEIETKIRDHFGC